MAKSAILKLLKLKKFHGIFLSETASDVPMIAYKQQLVVYSSNCDYRLQTLLID